MEIRKRFAGLMDKLVDASASYLVRQLQAGVDAVQIFDTWAGVLPGGRICTMVHRSHTTKSSRKVRSHVPDAKGDRISTRWSGRDFCAMWKTCLSMLWGLDWTADLGFVRDQIQMGAWPVQGKSRSIGAARWRRRARS